MTEASTQVLFEQTERFTVSWQISREGTVPALATDSTTGRLTVGSGSSVIPMSRKLTPIVYNALDGSWKRKDEEWRALK